MDHAAAQAWLDEAFFTPGALQADLADSQAVRDHLAQCDDCARYSLALRGTALKLDLARGASAQVRTHVLETARSLGRPPRPTPVRQPWWRGAVVWRLATAVLVVGVFGAALGAWWGQAARPGSADSAHLAGALAMVAHLGGDPGTHEMVLRDAAGNAAGMALVSAQTHQLAIFSASLPALSEGSYGCYLERAGQRTWIGPMDAAEGVQYWAGAMADSIEMHPGDLLVVASSLSAPSVVSAAM